MFVPGVVEQVAEIIVSDRPLGRRAEFAPGFVHPSEVHEDRGQIVAIELAVWLQLDCLTQFGHARFGLIVTGQAKSAIIVSHRVFWFGFQGSEIQLLGLVKLVLTVYQTGQADNVGR